MLRISVCLYMIEEVLNYLTNVKPISTLSDYNYMLKNFQCFPGENNDPSYNKKNNFLKREIKEYAVP